jgi:2'-5' RNA ligase
MRLFVALDIDEIVRQRIAGFVDGIREFAPQARWMRPESLHVTLKFIGERSPEQVDGIQQALETIAGRAFELSFEGWGFFTTEHAPRVFWIGLKANPELASLAAAVDTTLGSLGITQEVHPYNPHLTVARSGGGSGSPRRGAGDGRNRGFQRLQEKLAEGAESKLGAQLGTAQDTKVGTKFGTMRAREFFLYHSQISALGASYKKLAAFSLR